MPTDGTLFLENLPHSKQYLLTLLSVFFSLGAVLSSVVSYVLLPGHSCQAFEGCDIEGGANEGWRSVLFVLGLFVRENVLHSRSHHVPLWIERGPG
jgi:MFS family permease